MFFKLDCGQEVQVDAFYFQDTYIGMLEGRPNHIMNDHIIKKAASDISRLWGDRCTHIVSPILDESDPLHPILPPVCLTAWLICGDPIHPSYHGSELVVVWFRSECAGESIEQIISDGIAHLPWKTLAQDFHF